MSFNLYNFAEIVTAGALDDADVWGEDEVAADVSVSTFTWFIRTNLIKNKWFNQKMLFDAANGRVCQHEWSRDPSLDQ